MAFGIDDAIFLLLSAVASGTAAKAGQPDQPNVAAASPTGVGGGAPALPIPETQGAQQRLAGTPGLDLSPTAAVQEQLAQALALQGPAPTVPLEAPAVPFPSQTPGAAGIPAPTPPVPPTPPAEPPASIGEILAASPDALLAVSQILGIGRERPRDIAAPIPGGTVGNVVPGFGLPAIGGIGQLLAQIPRLG